MAPELPIEMPDRSRIMTVIELPEMECVMMRFGVRCNNLTTSGWLYPMPHNGGSAPVPLCDMCLSEMESTQ
jgi:hypothetical protein